MRMGDRRGSDLMNVCDKGHVLLAALMLIFLLGIAGMTSLNLAGQDSPGINAMKEHKIAQQLAEGAADVVMSLFHDPSSAPTVLAGLLAKRQGDGVTTRPAARRRPVPLARTTCNSSTGSATPLRVCAPRSLATNSPDTSRWTSRVISSMPGSAAV